MIAWIGTSWPYLPFRRCSSVLSHWSQYVQKVSVGPLVSCKSKFATAVFFCSGFVLELFSKDFCSKVDINPLCGIIFAPRFSCLLPVVSCQNSISFNTIFVEPRIWQGNLCSMLITHVALSKPISGTSTVVEMSWMGIWSNRSPTVINVCTIATCLAIETSLMGRMQLMIHGESLLYDAFVPGIMSRILE